ncbi:MAG: CCA tRNA nucleotidyltransferase [Clostridia bacterium]|nr:CCA tRNA nucleotidyltransferase [Clostridia bacterium]
MKKYLSQKLIDLANVLPKPIYVVGGFTRDFLINKKPSCDVDLASSMLVEEILPYVEKVGFKVKAEYKRTGTIVFGKEKEKYEYTTFRVDSYPLGGAHTPKKVEFTEDILIDAKRRDFKCNAIYYDIKNGEFVDPLGGIEDIKNKVLSTVEEPKKVFSHDGLRLMRLARFCGELNFTPTTEVIAGAKEFSSNIKDIAVERIFEELKKILISNEKHAFSNPNGHYYGLKLLDEIGVLEKILPEVTNGRNLGQRKDFHSYDVLEHTLKTVLYAEKEVRLFALLHDVGKPFAMQKDNKFSLHAEYGANIVKDILKRFKADNKITDLAVFLTKNHMLGVKKQPLEEDLRVFFVENYNKIPLLIMLKQADHFAGKDDLTFPQYLLKWKHLLKEISLDKTPLTIKNLKISAQDLLSLGAKQKNLSKTLRNLWLECVKNPTKNNQETLVDLAKQFILLDNV